MRLGPTSYRSLIKIIIFGLLWCLGGTMFTLLEYGVIGDLDYFPSTGVSYNFSNNIVATPIMSFLGGALLMIIDILVINKRLRRSSYLWRITVKTVLFLVIILLTTFLSAIVGTSITLDRPPYHPDVLQSLGKFFTSFAFWSILIYAGFVTILYLFIMEVSDSLGYSVFWNFFVGTYRKAKVEERIFMFMDLKNSTGIAESLGHGMYFEFLNQYFDDVGRVCLQNWGAIYQHVGDEVVMYWKLDKAAESLNCYFEIGDAISKHANVYKSKFGFIPEYRAGIHGGSVAIGEVGSMKKEILYMGDVLNATSRIQGWCKNLSEDLLVSRFVVDQINENYHSEFRFIDQGRFELRGKQEQMRIFSVDFTGKNE